MEFHRALLLIVSLAAFLSSTRTGDTVYALEDVSAVEDGSESKDYRLPTTMHPTAYTITITPTLSGKFQFLGEAIINVTVDTPTKSIVLHCGKITVLNQPSVTKNDKNVAIARTDPDEKTEMYKIDLQETLNAGDKIVLNFEYEGRLGDNMIGFYKSSYINSNNTLTWLASTQFQTTHARHAFPCFDEPSFKAKFTIRIIRWNDYIAISNMPKEDKGKAPDKPDVSVDIFEESVPMSTYLVAFAIFDFHHRGDESMKVWSRPNAINQTEYALDIGKKALRRLGIFFDEDYKLPKMDMVAVPDFSAGAMENWGMITYRESRLLYDEQESNVVAQQNVASVIVHEITHMWFGNLLTPAWWSYLWLSEGFARYFQYFGTAMIEQSWNMDAQFLVDQHQAALAVDGIETSKPMTREVKTPADISTIGDSITYSKGASIIRMMSHIVGTDNFKEALRVYIRDRKTKGIVEPANLWAAMQSVISSQIQIDVAMDSWTKQSGFPVLSVKIDKKKAILQQQRFLLRNLKSTLVNTTWHIPITYTTKKDVNFNSTEVKEWVTGEKYTLDVDISDPDWIVFNVQQTGFYRVNYEPDLWYRIIGTLNSVDFEKIHVYNRAGIIDDLLNLARAELLDYKIALDGLRYLQQEKHYLPFKAAFRAFDYLTQRFSGDELNYTLYKNYVLSLFGDLYENLGYVDKNNDDRLTILLRRELNDLACKFGHEKCVVTSLKVFRKWKKDGVHRIEPNQRSAAYCAAILHGDSEDWTYLWNHYKASNVASEQSVVLSALGCSNNTNILEQYLHYAISPYEENRIRAQDSSTVFSSVYSSSLLGANFVLDFVDKNHDKMAKYYGSYDTVGTILSGASRYLSTQELVDKFERLIEKHSDFSGIHQSLKSSLELAKYELTWYAKHADGIVSWIKDNAKLPGGEETTNYRLPGNVIPKKYILSLEPFLEPGNLTFKGYVQIIANVGKRTNEIVLHSSDIDVQTVQVLLVDQKPLNVVNISYKKKYDFLVITVKEILEDKTEVTIGIRFTGKLNNEMRGFYSIRNIGEPGTKRWLAATHLEPVGARKMFPCFDEPAMKAVFAVDVTIPEGYHAVSNMKAIAVEDIVPSKIWYNFEDTKIMSTYLLALVISDFETHNETVAGKGYGVWARQGTTNETSYALSLMEPLVNTYEKLLKHDYALTKLDMVALPEFVSGAMENWGLITFKESNMLWDPHESNTRYKQKVTNVISHEIAHQWFGDLVSPSWWKYVWLNEGFARYFQYFATSQIKNTWDLESQFIVDQLHSAFKSDALTSSHPMTQDVYSPTEIRSIFDSISYAKAASVIRMIEKTYGSDVFYAALHQYLEARKLNVASPEDLYTALADQITEPSLKDALDKVLDSWTTQAGYPVVTVDVSKDGNLITFSQERFLLRNDTHKSLDKIWHIPITWASESNPNFENTKPQFWLNSDSKVLVPKKQESWIIVNVQQAGYYRVNYDELSWKNIIGILKSPQFGKIHQMNRAALIDDIMNLARAEYVSYDLVLDAMEYLEHEEHYLPWRAFLNGLSYLDRKFQGQYIYKSFKAHVKKIMTPIVQKLIDRDEKDTVNTEHTSKLLRMDLHEWSCKYDIGDCIVDLVSIKPDYRPGIYCKLATSKRGWAILFGVYAREKIVSEKLVALKALGCSKREENLKGLLELAIAPVNESGIRYQDSTGVFASVYESSLVGVKYVMDFMKLNLKMMYDYYDDYSKIKTIMNGLSKRISTAELYDQYKELSDTIAKDIPTLKKSLKSYNDLILYEHNWNRKNLPLIYYWLEKRYPIEDYRLPKTLRPVYYNLTFALEDDKNFFDGTVIIDIEVVEPTSKIVLNCDYLVELLRITVYETPNESSSEETKHFKILGSEKIQESQKLIIYLDTYIDVPKISLKIRYRGNINSRPQGLYRATYLDADRNIKSYLATYLKPNYARDMFPCFDEPDFKAKFKLHIQRKHTKKSLSNMPLEKTLYNIYYNLDIYKESPVMSTHLVAFIISDLQPIRNEKEIFNIWGVYNLVGLGSSAQYAAFKYFEILKARVTNKWDLLDKVDLVALPNFPVSAMSNWGLITFQESSLFYDEDYIPLSQKYSILTTIARQIAHTYFGNLVTCEWWSFAWINEGLAQYFQWILLEQGLKESFLADHFVVNDMHEVMELDATPFSHALNYPDSTPPNFKTRFDSIASKKAASLMRMYHLTFGGTAFYMGVREYVLNNEYNTATPHKLWEALEINGRNNSIEGIMKTWVDNPGYPLVRVSLNELTGVLKFTQVRYTDGGISKFHIPITIASDINPNFEHTTPKFWLNYEELEVQTSLRNNWFIVNVQQSGYYRVSYDDSSWQRIIEFLNSNDYRLIHALNRAQIIDDLFNLALIHETSYANVFKAALYLRREQEYLPWKAFERGINNLWEIMKIREHRDYAIFQRFILLLTGKHFTRLGFDDTEDDRDIWPLQTRNDKLVREIILSLHCKFGNDLCIQMATFIFSQIDNYRNISQNAKPAVLCTAIKHGDKSSWESLWTNYLDTSLQSEQLIYLDALGCTESESNIRHYLRYIMDNNGDIRREDVPRAFASIYKSSEMGWRLCYQYVVDNYMKIYKLLGDWDQVAKLFIEIVLRIPDFETADKFDFFMKNNEKNLEPMSYDLNEALKIAKRTIQESKNQGSTIIYQIEEVLRDFEKDNSTDISATHNSNIILVAILSILPFLLIR